jgi:hypothetical protein
VGPASPALSEVSIVGLSDIGDVPVRETADLTSVLVGQLNNVRRVPLNLRTSVAAALTVPRPMSLRFEPAEVVLGPHLKTSVKVIAERGDAITEEIKLATNPEKNALPRDVTLALKPIPKGQTEVTLELAGGEKASPGPFSVVLTASHTKDKSTTTAISAPLAFRIEPAIRLQVDVGDRHLPRGGEQKLTVTITRNPAFAGDVTLTIDKLPPEVATDAITVPAGENRAVITLKASEQAAAGELSDVTLKAVAVGNDKLNASLALGKLTIQ